MKYTLPLLLALVGGCGGGIRTLEPSDFLYSFRCGAMPGEMASNSTATYSGRDETYHYVELHNSRPGDFVLGELSAPQKVRCRVDQLPSTFPAGFDPLRGSGTEGFESGEDTRQYVKTYLAQHHHGDRDGEPLDQP